VRLISSFLFLSLFVPSVAQAELISGSGFKSGAWSGKAYSNDETGKWSHCVVTASYSHNNFDLMFTLTDQYTLGVVLTHRSEPVFKGYEELQIVSHVDRFEPMYATADVFDNYTARVWFDDLDKAIFQMKKGNLLTLSSKIGTETFGLAGTFKALSSAYTCASNYENYVVNVLPKPQTNVASVWTPSPQETASMYQIATQIISDMQFQDFKFLTGDEDVLSGGKGVMWEANGKQILAGVFIGRERGDLDLQQIMSEDLATLTKWCDDGDLALVNSKYSVQGIDTSQLKGVCNSSEDPFTVFMTKQNVANTLVELLMFDYGGNHVVGSHDPDIGKNSAIISAKFLRE
jgi:hypothetical protein